MKAQLPSTADLEYFLAVAKEGTLSRAAERIGVSQPSLSIAMQRLEASMGVTLLLRSKTGIKLTAQGRRLVRSGQTLVEQ